MKMMLLFTTGNAGIQKEICAEMTAVTKIIFRNKELSESKTNSFGNFERGGAEMGTVLYDETYGVIVAGGRVRLRRRPGRRKRQSVGPGWSGTAIWAAR